MGGRLRYAMLSSLFVFLLLLLLSESLSLGSQSSDHPHNLNIFILAGQSNMAGRGGVSNDTVSHMPRWDGVVPSQCQPNPAILRLSSDFVWVGAHDPLHADIDPSKASGVGPGMPFANALVTRAPGFGAVGLVPCAVGGTALGEWEKGGVLYGQMIRRAEAAKGGASKARLKGMLWFQGESDTVDLEDALGYKMKLQRFFTDLRSDLKDPHLPIIQVGLASGEGPYVDIVRDAQLHTGLANVHCVDAKGLELETDGLHLTTAAQVKLGGMLAHAFLRASPLPPHATLRAASFAATKSSGRHSWVTPAVVVVVWLWAVW